MFFLTKAGGFTGLGIRNWTLRQQGGRGKKRLAEILESLMRGRDRVFVLGAPFTPVLLKLFKRPGRRGKQ